MICTPIGKPSVAMPDRGYGCRQPQHRRHARPYDLMEIGNLRAVDVEMSLPVWGMIVRECRGGHRRTQHHVE